MAKEVSDKKIDEMAENGADVIMKAAKYAIIGGAIVGATLGVKSALDKNDSPVVSSAAFSDDGAVKEMKRKVLEPQE